MPKSDVAVERIFRTIKQYLIAIVQIFAWSMSTSAMAQVELGINYSWWRFDATRMAECQARPGLIWQGNWIVDQYQEPGVRETVQRQLQRMRASGFLELRTILQHRRPPGGRLTGVFASTTGEASAGEAGNIRTFVADIAKAGYRGLEIAYGFQEQNSPFCRRREWGDCFDPASIEENWRFISETAEIARGAAGAMPLRFDLAGEACPATNMSRSTIANAGRFLTTIAGRFQSRFGSVWLISCPDSPNAERASLLMQVLRSAGLSPRYVEIHTYRTDPQWVSGALDGADAVARQLGAELIIGEMRYHSTEEMQLIQGWLRAHPQSRLRETFEWPLHEPASRCGMDTPPPYTP